LIPLFVSLLQLGACETQGDGASSQDKEKKNATLEMFADKKIRLLVVSTLVLTAAQQFSG
jgi:hypothetical protein